MDIVEDLAALRDRSAASRPVCVMARPDDGALIDSIVEILGLGRALAVLDRRARRRPVAHVDDDCIAVVAFAVMRPEAPLEVHFRAAAGYLVVVGADDALDVIRSAVRAGEDDGRAALADALLALAHHSEAALYGLEETAERLESEALGYSSTAQRRALGRMRSRLFALEQLYAAHHGLLAADGELADALAGRARRALRHAAVSYEESQAAAARLYVGIGDVLTQQTAVVSERLTLVSTIFLPLTVATGFFGMNFAWMVDHVGSALAFVLLGVVSPLLLALMTIVAIRRVTGTDV